MSNRRPDSYSANLFASKMIEQLKRAGVSEAMEYDPQGFRLLFPETGGTLDLRGFVEDYSILSRPHFDDWLLTVVRKRIWPREIPEDFTDARSDLRPVVRKRSELEAIRVQPKILGKLFPLISFFYLGDHLATFLAWYPTDDVPHIVNQDRLDAWGISLDEALEIGRQNLEELPFHLLEYEGTQVFYVRTGDNYDASRLLLKYRICRLPLEGDPVAIAVNENAVLIAGADDVDGLRTIAQLAGSWREELRPLCLIPLRLVEGEWASWLPPADHELHPTYRQLEMQYLFEAYSAQKLMLDEWHGQKGWEHFVAKCWSKDAETGPRSYAVWSQDVATHLPRTDDVHFYGRRGENPRRAEWDRVLQTVGHLMSLDEDSYPPRWFVDNYPTDDEFANMGAEPID